jgi:hypothetical protein
VLWRRTGGKEGIVNAVNAVLEAAMRGWNA